MKLVLLTGRAQSNHDPNHGFVLIEVLIALLLLTVLIVPLATGVTSAISRTDALQEHYREVCDATRTSTTAEAWGWGPKTVSVAWKEGPALSVDVEDCGESAVIVGVWTEGWFQGEWVLEDEGILEIPASEFSTSGFPAQPGAEIVVRTRCPDDAWGPPWRTIAPEGEDGLDRPAPASSEVAGNQVFTGSANVIHAPAWANPVIEVSNAGALLGTDRLKLLFDLALLGSGRCDVIMGDRFQSLKMENGRAVDVFF